MRWVWTKTQFKSKNLNWTQFTWMCKAWWDFLPGCAKHGGRPTYSTQCSDRRWCKPWSCPPCWGGPKVCRLFDCLFACLFVWLFGLTRGMFVCHFDAGKLVQTMYLCQVWVRLKTISFSAIIYIRMQRKGKVIYIRMPRKGKVTTWVFVAKSLKKVTNNIELTLNKMLSQIK